MAGVERVLEDIGHPLLRDDTVLVSREVGVNFEEALHLGLTFEPARDVSLEALGDDRGERFVAHQEFPAPLFGDVFVASRRIVNPIAILHPGAHLLRHLSAVLLALQHPLGGHDGLNELALRRVVEPEVQAFDRRPALTERVTQLEVEVPVACEALEVVEDDDEVLVWLGVEEGQKRDHAGTLHEVAAPGDRVGEHRLDRIALGASIFPAAGLLGVETVTFLFLGFRRDPAIDHGPDGSACHADSFSTSRTVLRTTLSAKASRAVVDGCVGGPSVGTSGVSSS